MKPLLSEYYQYLFAGHARIDVSHVPPSKQAQRKQFIITCIREKFKNMTEDEDLSLHFRRMLRQTGSELEQVLYGNQEDYLGPITTGYALPDDAALLAHFQRLNTHYLFFKQDDDESAMHFQLFFKICKMVNLFLEKSEAIDETIGLQAYKMLVWYGYTPGRNPFARAENHLSAHGSSFSQPLTDSLRPDLPINDPPIKKLEQWRKLIELHGQTAITLFQEAQPIEQGLKKNKLTLSSAINQAASLRYQRANEYPELASLCYQYDRPQDMFNQCLAIKPFIKTRDKLPHLVIEGKDHGCNGYCLVKMPADDPNAYLLGDISHSCQSIGAASEALVREGLLLENNGFLVLLKGKKPGAGPPLNQQQAIRYSDYEIVAHGYLWNSTSGLVLDSFEGLRLADEYAGIHLLKQYGLALLREYPQYRLFSLGAGGKTPAALLHEANTPLLFLTDPMLQGKQHLDSLMQFVLAARNLNERRDALKRRLINNKLGWDPDDIAERIAIDSLYTDSQFSSIECTLFDEEMCELIRFFETDNPEKFKQLFLNETGILLGLLYTLKQLNFTTDKIGCCKALSFTKISAIHSLKLLQQQQLLDHAIVKRLFSSAADFKTLTAIIHFLAAWNALNQYTLHLLLQAKTIAARFNLQDKIQRLARKNQVFTADFSALLALPPKLQQETLAHLCWLSEMDLFTSPNRHFFLNYPTHANALQPLMMRLKHLHNQFTETDYALFEEHLDKLLSLQIVADFLAEKRQLTLPAWRAVIPLAIKNKPSAGELKEWLNRHWNKNATPLNPASGRHRLFTTTSPALNNQDIDTAINPGTPPPA